MNYNTAVEVTVKVDDMDSFDDVRSKLNSLNIENTRLNSIKEEEVGFGIKSFKVMFLTVDEEGAMERIENALKSIPGTSFVVDRISRV